jgi:hypothetical protein
MPQFRADFEKQTVVAYGATAQPVARLPNCAVLDAKDWYCRSEDWKFVYSMHRGQYYFWDEAQKSGFISYLQIGGLEKAIDEFRNLW